MKRLLSSLLFFAVLLAVWHFLVQARIWSPVLLPDPVSVGQYLKTAAGDGTLLEAAGVTLRRLFLGYAIGILLGIPVGLLTARFRFMEDTVGVMALGLQTLPSV